ncbi:MAG: PQQ-binding-like beta-propeller repeat protein, partial [Desulfobulbaceae bacterium]|nr:PQQ-binding-like beta-propeller repeat protein [Desulfobulbaceae bacterium]
KANLGSRVESTPVADDDGIYVVTTKGELVCMDGKTGAVRWKKDSGGPVLFSSRPLIAENKIFVATSYGNVSAFGRDGTREVIDLVERRAGATLGVTSRHDHYTAKTGRVKSSKALSASLRP